MWDIIRVKLEFGGIVSICNNLVILLLDIGMILVRDFGRKDVVGY